jgi:hypothetical protein
VQEVIGRQSLGKKSRLTSITIDRAGFGLKILPIKPHGEFADKRCVLHHR